MRRSTRGVRGSAGRRSPCRHCWWSCWSSRRGHDVKLAAHGLSIDLPHGWEGRIFRRRHGDPTLHAGTFTLPFEDGEFGTRSTGRMPVGATFMTITEYRAGNALVPGRGLFASEAIPLPI